MKRGALAELAGHLDLAAQLLHITAHDVHSNAAARHVGGLFRRGEAGHEDQLMHLFVGQHIIRADEAARAGLRQDAVLVQAVAVIADLHSDVSAAMAGIEVDDTGG